MPWAFLEGCRPTWSHQCMQAVCCAACRKGSKSCGSTYSIALAIQCCSLAAAGPLSQTELASSPAGCPLPRACWSQQPPSLGTSCLQNLLACTAVSSLLSSCWWVLASVWRSCLSPVRSVSTWRRRSGSSEVCTAHSRGHWSLPWTHGGQLQRSGVQGDTLVCVSATAWLAGRKAAQWARVAAAHSSDIGSAGFGECSKGPQGPSHVSVPPPCGLSCSSTARPRAGQQQRGIEVLPAGGQVSRMPPQCCGIMIKQGKQSYSTSAVEEWLCCHVPLQLPLQHMRQPRHLPGSREAQATAAHQPLDSPSQTLVRALGPPACS